MISGSYVVAYFLVTGHWTLTLVSLAFSAFVLHELFGEETLLTRLNYPHSHASD
jgi:hypothetical protein